MQASAHCSLQPFWHLKPLRFDWRKNSSFKHFQAANLPRSRSIWATRPFLPQALHDKEVPDVVGVHLEGIGSLKDAENCVPLLRRCGHMC